jgi:hypothetical protein
MNQAFGLHLVGGIKHITHSQLPALTGNDGIEGLQKFADFCNYSECYHFSRCSIDSLRKVF